MSNTRPIKIMIPEGQVSLIQEWVDAGLFASVTAFCTIAVENKIVAERTLQIDYDSKKDGSEAIPQKNVGRT